MGHGVEGVAESLKLHKKFIDIDYKNFLQIIAKRILSAGITAIIRQSRWLCSDVRKLGNGIKCVLKGGRGGGLIKRDGGAAVE